VTSANVSCVDEGRSIKYICYIALVVLAFLSFPLVIRQQRYSRDTQAMRKLLRSAWIDDTDLSLQINSFGEEVYSFTASDDQLYYLLKREDIVGAGQQSFGCDELEDKAFCSRSVRQYPGLGPNGVGLPGIGHPGIFALYRLPEANRVIIRIGWDFAI